MQITDSFIEKCANEYFNSFNQKGIYPFQRFSFGEFVEMKRREIERRVMK